MGAGPLIARRHPARARAASPSREAAAALLGLKRLNPRLGRNSSVILESWRLTDDPRQSPPQRALLACGWSAQEAARLAHATVSAFQSHGYQKTQGFWWASDGLRFHRVWVIGGRLRPAPGHTGSKRL